MQTTRQWIKAASGISDEKASKKASASAKRRSSRLTPLFSPRALDLAYVHTSTQANAAIKRFQRSSYVPNYSSLALACGMGLMAAVSAVRAQTVTLPTSSGVALQTYSPGATTFDVPTTSVITGSGISGNNAQNWYLTIEGSVGGTSMGVSLSSATAGGATIDNFGTVTVSGTSSCNTGSGVAAYI